VSPGSPAESVEGETDMTNHDDDGRRRGPWHHARFGSIAVRKRYIDAARLHEALERQRDEDAAGLAHRLLGEILLHEGWLSPWELEDVLMTKGDLDSGSLRTGDTPSQAFAIGAALDGDVFVATRRATARRLVRDVLGQGPTVAPDALLGDALDAAFEVEAEAVLVMNGRAILGALPVWDCCQLDRDTPVRGLLRETIATVSESTTVEEVALILRESDAPCVAVISGGRLAGVVTRRELRRSGVRPEERDEDAIPFGELGGGG
jgi:CBS domain-containing protein